MKSFKIHSIVLTKNEEDVVEACLREALVWSDAIYVYDGASDDRTWEIVNDMARDNPRIVPWKQDGKVFSEGLRAEVFAAFRDRASSGDWWCQLNIDEFFAENPRSVLAEVPGSHQVVWGTFIQYCLTEMDLDRIDFSLPFDQVRNALRYYELLPTSEARFFRHRQGLVWSPEWAWPLHVGLNHPERIGIRHYPLRSPQQIQTRLDVRRDNRARGFEGWCHASQEQWRDSIRAADGLHVDGAGADYQLPQTIARAHVERPWIRLVKRVMHGSGIWA